MSNEQQFYPKDDEDLVIRVDWFKPSGKWAYGGEVNVGKARLWRGDIPQAIIDRQEIIGKNWYKEGYYTVVTRDTDENWSNPNYRAFTHAIFTPDKFIGLELTNKGE
jgi:hypothetical protein